MLLPGRANKSISLRKSHPSVSFVNGIDGYLKAFILSMMPRKKRTSRLSGLAPEKNRITINIIQMQTLRNSANIPKKDSF
jgi:hypothetical protein